MDVDESDTSTVPTGGTNENSGGGDSYSGDSFTTGFQHGGLTRGEGLAYLHPNEAVLPVEAGAKALVEEMNSGGDTFNFDIDVEGAMDERDLAKAVREEFARELRYDRTRVGGT
ncbi:hypothetical protein BRC95_08890 [Halobacteriales archaeon QS_5_68_33]|nr:MAG: hypothetical protein BRC95_08890 [Halobacteriales archaeon QS_5_68_33]